MWQYFALIFLLLVFLPIFFRYILWYCANDESPGRAVYLENLALALILPFNIILLIYTMLPPHEIFYHSEPRSLQVI